MLAYLAAIALRPLPLRVVGNKLMDADLPVRLEGLNVPSFEWSDLGEFVFRSCRVAMEDWNANCIRLPVSEDRWFGKAESQKNKYDDYRDSIDEVVTYVTNRNGYLILDLHWSDANVLGKNIGQHDMPDDNSTRFWQDAANAYKNNPHVLFGLYNEPHDVSWDVWRDGGDVTEKDLHYHTPGMQALLDTVRKTRAKNVVVIGGLDWAYDLSGLANYALKDPNGNGIVYDTHIYPWKTDWDNKVGIASRTYPVIVGEVGCSPEDNPSPAEFVPKVFSFIDSNNLNWTAWSFHPKAKPCVIADWSYAPTPYWGVAVKDRLAKRSQPGS
jgi:hypothetical protein